MRMEIIGILVCTLLIATANPMISGIKTDNSSINYSPNNILTNDSDLGYIYPEWITLVDDLEKYEEMKIYNDFAYVSGWKLEGNNKKIIMVYKLDISDGSLIWKKELPLFEKSADPYDIEVFNQGIYVIVGLQNTFTFYLCKLDLNGEIIWNKLISEDEHCSVFSIIEYENILYLSGFKEFNPRLMTLDTDGNIISDTMYKLPDADAGIINELKIHDNYLYGIGESSTLETQQDFLLMKLDLEGNLLWHKIWGGSQAEVGEAIDFDDSYIYAYGYHAGYTTANDFYDILIKFDPDGVLIWDTYSGTQSLGSDIIVYNDFIYTTGNLNRNGEFCATLFKYNENAELIYYLIGKSTNAVNIEIYEDYLYMSAWHYILKFDIYLDTNNYKPERPQKPSGPTDIRRYLTYTYSSASIDPDEDQLSYCFSWGDGSNTYVDWFSTGNQATASHFWTEKGQFTVKVRARDQFGHVSEWSDPLSVTMPRTVCFRSFLLELLEHYPNMFPLLRYILGL